MDTINKTKKESANPLPNEVRLGVPSGNSLPYVISFSILFLILLAVLAWVLDLYNKAHKCPQEPNIWCFDTWMCNNNCSGITGTTGAVGPNGPVNGCFINATSPTGLASCLYGPNSDQATICLIPEGGVPTGGSSCDCTVPMTNQKNNCLSNCPLTLDDVPDDTICCKTGSTQAECNPNG